MIHYQRLHSQRESLGIGLSTKLLNRALITQAAYDVRDVRKIQHQMTIDSNDYKFTIIAAKHIEPLTFDSFSLLLWTAPDIETLLTEACKYSITIGAPIDLKLSYSAQGNAEIWVMNREPLDKESAITHEGMTLFIAVLIEIIYKAAANNNIGLRVELISWPYSEADKDTFEELMNCQISEGAPVRKIVVPKNFLPIPLKSANPDVHLSMKTLVVNSASKAYKRDIVLQVHKVQKRPPLVNSWSRFRP